MFEIKIFPGDPNRGQAHVGYMFSLRLSDNSYVKSARGYSRPEEAAWTAALEAERIEKEIACRG